MFFVPSLKVQFKHDWIFLGWNDRYRYFIFSTPAILRYREIPSENFFKICTGYRRNCSIYSNDSFGEKVSWNIRVWKILETSNRRRREPSKVSGSDGKWENKKKRRDKSGGRSGAWGTREDRRDVSWSVGWARVERMNGWMDSAMKPLKRKHAYSVSRSLPRLLRSSRGTSSRLFRIASLA